MDWFSLRDEGCWLQTDAALTDRKTCIPAERKNDDDLFGLTNGPARAIIAAISLIVFANSGAGR